MKNSTIWLLILLLMLAMPLLGCGDDDDDDDNDSAPADDDDDTSSDDDDDDNDVTPDDDDDDDDDTVEDPIPVFSPAAYPPADSVLPASVTSCAVYQEEDCVGGTLRRCRIYDGAAKGWVANPDPMLEQMYWYDRYYDLYQRMEGQHSDVEFTEPQWPGTPESTWSQEQYFREYDGYGDAAGWTGTGLQSAAARYSETGTEADYDRMLEFFEDMMFLYEANDIPGLLMRSHFAMLEDGAPKPIGHWGKAVAPYHAPGSWHFRYPLEQEFLDRLPSYYTEGVQIPSWSTNPADHYDVTPVWMGDASRDMYVRSLPGTMLAYDLLGDGSREDELRTLVETEIPCSLNRLKKLKISNLQSSRLMIELVTWFLGADRIIGEPDDLDLTTVDTVIGYVMEQPNPDFMQAFDASCPADPPMEVDPAYDMDVENMGMFLLKLASLMYRSSRNGQVPVAWFLTPSVRGSDVVFMTQWGLAAHYLTGEEKYRGYVKSLMDENEYWPVIDLMNSFYSPKWCFPHFGPSLLYPSLWNMQIRVDPAVYPTYWTNLGTAIMEETRYKELEFANDAYFGILYDVMVDDSIDPDADDYAQEMVQMLRETGQYQVADKMEPRRNYTVDHITTPLPGIQIEYPTQEELDMCLMPFDFMGEHYEFGDIEDDRPRAVEGLPIEYRVPGSFLWAMDPYMLWRDYGGGEAMVQWPMQGFSVAFWTGRFQGTITEGETSALAWFDTGESCPD
jgi:hypothetical protein